MSATFLERGQPDHDRDFRHPRVRADKSGRREPVKARRDVLDAPVKPSNKSASEWDLLPPLPEIIDGVNRFTRHYFQLGFIPKEQFSRRLLQDHQSVSVFLVVSILSISARLSPPLSTRYGSGMKAAEFFMERAAAIAPSEIFVSKYTLESCQAFYLLSIAQQGSGIRNESHMNMGIALRMASALRLHLEETYDIANPTPDTIIRGESARRTLWMLHSQDQLHSGPHSPISLSASDITALLPCNEDDFALGREPPSRAALEGSPPSISNPALICDPSRSLFASLIQAHGFWGIITRRAVSFTRSSYPWEPESKFATVSRKLDVWENSLPPNHRWSEVTFGEHKAEAQDLAYLGVTMIPRLCNIVLRRPYLVDILTFSPEYKQRPAAFTKIAYELFSNVRALYTQIDAQFTGRASDESVGAQMAAFCVYTCGLLSTYLCHYPSICPDPNISRDGHMMYQRTLSILLECKEVWPLASRWADALERFAQDPTGALTSETGMADGRDPVPHPVIDIPAVAPASPGTSPASSIYSRQASSIEPGPSSLQSPSPHGISATLSATHILPSHFPPPQIQQQPQMQQHQLQVHQHHQHRQHRQHRQHHQPPAPIITQHQSFVPHQLQPQLYMSPNEIANLDIVMGTFDQSAMQGYQMAPQCNPPLTSTTPTVAAIPPVPHSAPADGYENELNFYSYGSHDWVPSGNVFDGYN
ncbi:uncharacterized protein FIESC28_06557 [Fusarium coffeatum]|uniref:Xylanolytic transcriptional activator regulatory domain-containing protein n=1 Tax=Fusarium coffeatum TaxID=231269 RepID=A0A366RL93_9HYPO|nr:uncharacterized protein FIESC28_06557 [Fusarium coffeatum]RBR17055.1 hypothetical protein FIESC28_06557 [Fusarium coffeatum]